MTPQRSKAVDSQAQANRSTRDHWRYFASHRAQIQGLILPEVGEAPPDGRRLCVLGAGNCNDIDLKALTEAFKEVHLVDLDAPALEAAVERQGVKGLPRVKLHGGVDLTGIAELFPKWEKAPPTPAEVEAGAARALDWSTLPLGGPFDAVLSPCLLSQLVGYASDVLGRAHPRRRELLVALRARHLRTLADLLAPGGTGVVVCDVASSAGYPELLDIRKEKLPDLLDRLTYTERGFDGLSPAKMRAAIAADPTIAPLLGPVQQVPPWLWTLGPRKTFLVYALRFRRLSGPVLLSR